MTHPHLRGAPSSGGPQSLDDHDCLCLRHWDFSETSQTVGLLSRDLGLVRALAKGSRRERGAFGGGIDLLTRGSAGLSVRKGRELSTMARWRVTHTWGFLRTDLRANQAMFLIADIASRILMPHDPHPGAFDALVDALNEFEQQTNVDAIVVRTLWRLLVETGHDFHLPDAPTLSTESNEGAASMLPFFPRDGGFIRSGEPLAREALRQGTAWPVRGETARALVHVLSATDIHATAQIIESSAPGSITRAARLIAAATREVLGHEPPTLPIVYPEIAGTHAMATIAAWASSTAAPH